MSNPQIFGDWISLFYLWVKEEINEENIFQLNENETTPYKNIWVPTKAILREEFIFTNSYVRKEERSEINILNFHLMNPKRELIKCKASRKKIID